uniref:Uncharacterized protein n=2 Tax=Synechococcus elongatus TaxID=32046 RepID=Q53571_SYNE7|nr:hypothetical protein A - Synechococcus sp. (strain PCC 7942) plasmid pUH24 [Synechococcus sp.]AAB21870.1 unknown [Synechococcus elongatus PCC 7942 = FACHB-805]
MPNIEGFPSSAGGLRLTSDDPEMMGWAMASIDTGAIVQTRSLAIAGRDSQGQTAFLVIDCERGEFGVVTVASERAVPADLPRLAAIAEVIGASVAASRRLAGTDRSDEPVRSSIGSIGLEVQTSGQGGAWLRLDGLEIRLGGLLMLQLLTELHGLIVRETHRSLETRNELEKAIVPPKPSTSAPHYR